MPAISSYRGNRPTHKQTQTGPITIHCAAASAQCKNSTGKSHGNHGHADIDLFSRTIITIGNEMK